MVRAETIAEDLCSAPICPVRIPVKVLERAKGYDPEDQCRPQTVRLSEVVLVSSKAIRGIDPEVVMVDPEAVRAKSIQSADMEPAEGPSSRNQASADLAAISTLCRRPRAC